MRREGGTWKLETVPANQARDGEGLDKGGSNRYIEKWSESGSIPKREARNLLILKGLEFYFASPADPSQSPLAYILFNL